MAREVIIRRYRKQDESDAVHLVLSKLPVPRAEAAFPGRLRRWRWQYDENPFNSEKTPTIWVAEVDNILVGMEAAMPLRLRTPSGRLPAAWGTDLIVDGSHRRRGIGRKLTATAKEYFPSMTIISYNKRSLSLCRKLSFETVSGFWKGWFVFSPLKFMKRLIRKRQSTNPVLVAGSIPRCGRGSGHGCRAYASSSIMSFLPDGTDTLWQKVSGAYTFAADRNPAFLSWRYTAHPDHTYHFVRLDGQVKPEGLAVVRLSRSRPRIGIIYELLIDPMDGNKVSSLFQASLDFIRSNDGCAAFVVVPPMLARAVFASPTPHIRQPLDFLGSANRPELKDQGFYNGNGWYLSMGDSDIGF